MKKRYLALALAAVLAVCVAGCGKEKAKDDSNKTAEKGTVDTTEILQAQMPEEGEEIAVITTSKGVVKMRFFPEEAPKAVENFKTLAKKGYYNGLLFHRVIEDFMVQTGDPKGDGTGGESCWGEAFEDEISPKLHYYRGAVAMANSGANTNGSQFFIVNTDPFTGGSEELDYYNKTIRPTQGHAAIDYPAAQREKYIEAGGTPWLDNVHTVFGQVYEGLDVVTKIMSEASDSDEPVVIKSITVSTYGE